MVLPVSWVLSKNQALLLKLNECSGGRIESKTRMQSIVFMIQFESQDMGSANTFSYTFFSL